MAVKANAQVTGKFNVERLAHSKWRDFGGLNVEMTVHEDGTALVDVAVALLEMLRRCRAEEGIYRVGEIEYRLVYTDGGDDLTRIA